MYILVEVGRVEKHQVEFSFDQVFGRWGIKVDGKVVMRGLFWISFSPVKAYTFDVGHKEKLTVRIEQERRLLFPFLFPYKYRVFVDDVLAMSTKGY